MMINLEWVHQLTLLLLIIILIVKINSAGAEGLGEVRAHLLTMNYLTFISGGIKMHINSSNIFKHTLFLSPLRTFLQQ